MRFVREGRHHRRRCHRGWARADWLSAARVVGAWSV